MSFGSGPLLDVGTLVSKFTLDATGAKATISSINQSADQIKNAFGNVTFKLDASQSQGAITQLTAATAAFKDAQTQATLALADQRTTLTGTKAALDQQRTATEQARTATAGNTAALLNQRTATEAARTSLVQTRAELTQMALAEKQAAQEAQNSTSSFSGLKRSLELIGGLAIFGVLVKGASDLKDAIFGTNAAIEQAQLKFTALSGSAQTATTLMGQLETLAAHSTFGLTQITEAAGGLEAFGVNVANIPPLLNAMQNAAAAAGGDMAGNFTNLARVLGELAGGLPLTERQIRQLVTAGIPLQPLADQLGITVNQLLDVGKTGIVTGDQLVAAFAKVYTSGNLGDFMQKQAGTFNGALALIKTNVSLAAATAFKPLFDVVSNLAVKFGEFVQTATFNEWVKQISAGMGAVIGLFKEFAAVLAPVGDAVAKFFGLNTGNIGAQMDAVKGATIDVGAYNASLQGSGAAANDSKAELQGYKDQVDAASAAILGLNGQLADNQVLLDGNARSIAAVKNQYDPIIKSAEQSIRDINTPTADELARKTQELQLDRDRANLELTKPDTSIFDTRILSDQTTLDNMPALDTSGYDTAITGYQGQIEALQESISGLNTDEFNAKINAIRDKLAEPAPDTHGISNQLTTLEAQLAGGTISRSQFDSQYGALSLQKQNINQAHEDSTAGLSGQLKLLEAQKADQELANKETAQADRQRIRDLEDQVKIQEKGRADAQKADAKARKDLEDDIKREGNLRTQALAPYTAAMKTITDAQAINSAKDAAAAAQRALDVAPYQAALDKAKATEDSLLAPLLAQKQIYDDTKTSLTEARQQQELAKQAAEGQATALKDAAANAKLLGENLNPASTSAKAALPLGGGAAAAALGVGANLNSQLDPSPFVQFVNTVAAKLHELTTSDDWSVVFTGKHKDGTPVSTKARFDTAITDIFLGVDTIDSRLQAWIKSHDADGMWGVLIYGKNPDGSTATAKEQLGVFFGGINYFITTWLSENGPKWLTSWTQIGTDLGKAWDGPDNFNWTTIGRTLGATNAGIDGWLGEHAPKWLTSWNSLGSDLRNAWDGPDSFNWTAIGHFFSGIAGGIDKFGTDHFPGWLTSWQGLVDGLGNAFSGLGDVIAGHLSGPKDEIGKFFNMLGSGVHWLAQHFPGVKDVPDFNSGAGASSASGGTSGSGAGAGIGGNAEGTKDWKGGWSWVGEKGPELAFLPQHSIVVPNHVATNLPGFADGLNFDFLGDALGKITSFVTGSAEKAVNALMDKIGTPDVGIIPGLGTSLFDMAKNGLLSFLTPQEAVSSGSRSGNLDIVRAVKAASGDPDIWLSMLMAVASEERTLTGPFVDQIGGGPGRGPFQIEAGPGGSNVGMISEADARDPFTAAQYMVGRFINAKRGPWGTDNETAGAMTAAAAEVGAAFLAGNPLGYPQAVVDAAYQMATQALAAPVAAGPFPGSGFPNVFADARSHLGEMFHAGHEWNLWCEQFAELAGEDVGYPHLGWPTALAHALGVTLNSGIGPPGSTMLWGSGYYPDGHAAISVGDGSVIGTSARGISQYDMAGAADYRGWAPPGLKDGAFFPANTPTLAMVGEGASPEITAPVPMLKQSLRDVMHEQGSGGVHLHGPITIHASTYAEGQAAAAGLLDALQAKGHIV